MGGGYLISISIGNGKAREEMNTIFGSRFRANTIVANSGRKKTKRRTRTTIYLKRREAIEYGLADADCGTGWFDNFFP